MNTSKYTSLAFFGIFALLFATGVHAEPWDDSAAGIKDIMYGPLGTTLGIICLAGLAIGGFSGRMEMKTIAMSLAALVLFFSAPAVVSFIKARTGASSASAAPYITPAAHYAMAPTALKPLA